MTDTSIRTDGPPTQEPRTVAQWENGAHVLRLIETDQPGVLHLRRYRKHADPPYSIAAVVSHAGGVVSSIRWDPWHAENATGQWLTKTAHWVRAMVARDWADR